MNLVININKDKTLYSFPFLSNSNFSRIELLDEFIIDVFKSHNHSYYFKAFFYHSKNIYSFRFFNSKYKLYCAVQELLEEELYDVIQY